MREITTEEVRGFLRKIQGQHITLRELRSEFNILPGTKSFDTVRNIMWRLSQEKIVRLTGGKGEYKVVTQVKPVKVFAKDRERRPPFNLLFPKDFDTGMEMPFAEHIIVREGDLITLGGRKNRGKTCLALNFCGENIKSNPVLMGNEYTTRVGEIEEYEPSARFINRLEAMDWIEWTNGTGDDAFTLLPVRGDYAEHIVKDRINIIDWINLDASRLFEISKVMDDIKSELGRGIAIVVLQKGEGNMARGGQFTKDFTDCELLIDEFTPSESMITVGDVKETTQPVMGRTFAFGIAQGVKIINFREIVKCPACFGKKWKRAGSTSIPCNECNKTGYVDKK
jgi:hypothetical protein